MRFLFALGVGCALCAPAFAADPAPVPADAKRNPILTAEEVLAILHEQDVTFEEGNLNDVPLFELMQKLTKRYKPAIVFNVEAFRASGVNDIIERKPNLAATQLKGLSLHRFLTVMLESMNATYLVKNGLIEIVPISYAAKVTKNKLLEAGEGSDKLAEPLVSLVVKEKPLNETVALIAERYDLTVVVSPQAGDARMGFVTTRLLNMPADKALELVALQADLRVVRKGNAYLITSRDHANDLLNEGLEKERQKIEVEKLRAEVGKPQPPKPPEMPPEPKQEK
ncbi:MAG: hypothetical protein U0792_07285 [Gemmataceae bacterium]